MGVRDFLAIHWEELNYVLPSGQPSRSVETLAQKSLGLWVS